MATKSKARLHVELEIRALDSAPEQRKGLVNGVAKNAPLSPLFAKPGVKEAVTNLETTYDAYLVASGKADGTRKQLKIDEVAELQARDDNNKAVLMLQRVVETTATTADEIVGTGLKPLVPNQEKAPPEIPDAVIV